MPRIIDNFDPNDRSRFGRWKDNGMCWDLETGEAINIETGVIDTHGGFLVPRQDEEATVISGDQPGKAASQNTIGIGTEYFFETAVIESLPDGENLDTSRADDAIEPWGFATAETTDKVYQKLKPYVSKFGGFMAGFAKSEKNTQFPSSQLQRCVQANFGGKIVQTPAGAVAQRLANQIVYDATNRNFRDGDAQVLNEVADALSKEAAGK